MADDKKEDMGTKLSAPADFDGPMANRGCTDILCLLLLVAMWAATTGELCDIVMCDIVMCDIVIYDRVSTSHISS